MSTPLSNLRMTHGATDLSSTDVEIQQWVREVTTRWGRHRTWERERCAAASFAFHGVFLLIFFLMPPRPPALTPELLPLELPLVRSLLTAELHVVSHDARGGTGAAHDGEHGAAGTESVEKGRFAIEGTASVREARVTSPARHDPASGVLGVLAQSSSAWDSLTSPYVPGIELGADPMRTVGWLMGDQIGAGAGAGGLGVHGTGRGAGGAGLGTIELGTIRTVGHGAGLGSRQGYGGHGYGSSAGTFQGRSSTIVCAIGRTETRGRLSREVVRRVIRRHLNEVRFCYAQGLEDRPDLAGRVTVQLVINSLGMVWTSAVESSTLGNIPVEQCVVNAVRRWTFPESDGATAVTYPLVFDSQ